MSIITGYLDQLLRTGTERDEEPVPVMECPERQMDTFRCLKFISGGYPLLMPFDRISRIDFLAQCQPPDGHSIPACQGEERLQLSLIARDDCINIEAVLEPIDVENSQVIWRRINAAPFPVRAPWFVGTHKSLLCRIFDPSVLFHCLNS